MVQNDAKLPYVTYEVKGLNDSHQEVFERQEVSLPGSLDHGCPCVCGVLGVLGEHGETQVVTGEIQHSFTVLIL